MNCWVITINIYLISIRNSYKLKLSKGERRKKRKGRLRNEEVLQGSCRHNMKKYNNNDKQRSGGKWNPRMQLQTRSENYDWWWFFFSEDYFGYVVEPLCSFDGYKLGLRILLIQWTLNFEITLGSNYSKNDQLAHSCTNDDPEPLNSCKWPRQYNIKQKSDGNLKKI